MRSRVLRPAKRCFNQVRNLTKVVGLLQDPKLACWPGGTKVRNLTKVACWPDGTPKKFQDPKEEWRNWINYDSSFREQTDELNRERIFFWEVDLKGRLWRKELAHLEERFGEMKDIRIVDYFFSRVQRNQTGMFEEWPWVSYRMHEKYFLRCALSTEGGLGGPVVFNDLRSGNLLFLSAGSIASGLTTKFEPGKLRLTPCFKLYHPLQTKALVEDLPGKPRQYESEIVPALIDVSTSQKILGMAQEEVTPVKKRMPITHWGGRWENHVQSSGFELSWEGKTFLLPLMPSITY